MKKIFTTALLIFVLVNFAFSQNSIADIIKAFDEDLMNAQSTDAQVTIGFITYADSNTCGTIVPYLQDEIKTAAKNSRRIKIIKTTELSEYEQAGIATRGMNLGMSANAKKIEERIYNLDGKYYDRGSLIELVLIMYNPGNGNVLAQRTAYMKKSLITEKKLTLFPDNKKIAEEIQNDFEKTATSQQNKKSTISLAASMLDSDRCLVDIVHPNDIVRFKISADTDCYIAILCIDANGIKTWLPITNNYLEAGKTRFFPDIPGKVLTVNDDGVFGAEQVVIFACTNKDGLPRQENNGKYSNQDLNRIIEQLQETNKTSKTGTFKITYTILEK